MNHADDRISDGSIRLVVTKRRAPDSVGDVASIGDAETRAAALLATLEHTADLRARARILVEIAITFRDGLDDPDQLKRDPAIFARFPGSFDL